MPKAVIATFNVRHGRGLDGRVDLERTARLIRRMDADLVALQELDRFNRRSGNVDQPAELQELCGVEITFVPTIARDGWEYGIGVAARGGGVRPLDVVDLPRAAAEEPRKAIVAEWRNSVVVSTHLAREPEASSLQQEIVARLVSDHLPSALVIGDLNRTLRQLRALRRLALTPARTRHGTVRPWWRLRQVDHVLLGGSFAVERTRILATEASDHRPLVVSVR